MGNSFDGLNPISCIEMECLSSMNMIQNHYHILVQAVIQLVCWRYILNFTRQYVTENCTNLQWFRRWSSKPNGFGGETGDDFVIGLLAAMTQHIFGGFFIAAGYYMQSPQCFVIGALSEFAFEALDMVRGIKQHLDGKGKHWVELVFLILHHQGAFTAILPACMYYADNEDIQQIAWGLLGFSPIVFTLMGFNNTRDVYNLQERGQFTVSYSVMVVLHIYFRWYITVTGMYGFLTGDEFGGLSFGLQLILIVYCIAIKLFDLFCLPLMLTQFYQWMFTPKCMERPTKITKASLMRPCSVPVQLIRMQSTPLF